MGAARMTVALAVDDPVPPVVAAKPASRVIAMVTRPPRRLWLATLRRVVTENVLPPVIVIATLIGLWQFATGSGTSALPSPLQVWADSGDLILRPFYVSGTQDIGLGWRVLTSLERVGMGFGLAAIVGVLVGAVIGQSVWLMRGVDPLFQILRTVPPLAWLPISLAAFMDSRPSAIFVIFITAIWPIIINTTAGVRAIPQDYRNVAAVLRLNQAQFFFKIMIPAAAPYIFSGLRIGVGLAWLAIVAAEMLTGGVGIGFFIWDAWNSSLLSDIIVALLYIGVTGFVLDRLVAFIGRVVSRGTMA
jgi:nitrate/nitrite transport system permease protein